MARLGNKHTQVQPELNLINPKLSPYFLDSGFSVSHNRLLYVKIGNQVIREVTVLNQMGTIFSYWSCGAYLDARFIIEKW